MTNRYESYVTALRESVLRGRGDTPPALRETVESRAAALAGAVRTEGMLPRELLPFVDTVATHAYRVTDDDVEALKRAGYSEDAIFEITASAALGAALGRLERGMAALEGGR